MALKIDFITEALVKLKDTFTLGINSSNIIKESGNINLLTNPNILQRTLREGVIANGFSRIPGSYAFDGVVTPEANGSLAGSAASVQPVPAQTVNRTKLLIASKVHVYTSAACWVGLNFGVDNQGGRVVINGTQIFDGPFYCFNGQNLGIALYGLLRPTTPEGNRVVATFSMEGSIVSCDVNYMAKKSIMVLGDSNTEGGSVVTETGVSGSLTGQNPTCYDMWHWILRAKYRKDWDQDVRLIDKSVGGRTSTHIESQRTNGFQLSLHEAPNLIIYNLGTNDTDVTISQNNIIKFLDWVQYQYPKSKVIVVGSAPRQVAASETLLSTIRNNQRLAVEAINNPNIIFINGGLSFSGSDNSMYSGTENAGLGIHLSMAGQIAFANYIINQINTNYPSFKTL